MIPSNPIKINNFRPMCSRCGGTLPFGCCCR